MAPIFDIISADLKFHAPYTHRVILLCLEKGIPFHITPIDLYNKPEWFLNLAPNGEIPVMRINNSVIPDSFAIAKYLDQQYEPYYVPLQQNNNNFYNSFIKLMGEIDAFGKALVTFFKNYKYNIHNFRILFSHLEKFNNHLKNMYLMGNEINYSDLALLPHILGVECLDHNIFPFSLMSKVPNLQCWLSRMKTRASVQNSTQNFADGFIEHLQHRGFYTELMR